MSRKAIDIVLLPCHEIMEDIVSINKSLITDGEQIPLDVKSCLPHISLRMGVVDAKDLKSISELVSKMKLPELIHLNGLDGKINSFGKRTLYLNVKNNQALMDLHLSLMKMNEKYFQAEVCSSHFNQSDVINSKTINYVRNFSDYAFDNFHPHITIGYGDFKNSVELRDSFIPTLAIFHLGNNCTCREVLIQTE